MKKFILSLLFILYPLGVFANPIGSPISPQPLDTSAVSFTSEGIFPVSDNTADLGSVSLRWADFHYTISTGTATTVGSVWASTLLDVSGSVYMNVATPNLTASNAYAILATDYTVLINDSDADVTGTVTVTLPAVASSTGRILTIKKIGSAQTVTVDGADAETIDGATTVDITVQYNSITIQCDGTAWWVL